MKVVYVIGPLRAATPHLVEQNIRAAEAVARQVWQAGLPANCVHSSTRFMHGAAPEEVFLAGTLAQLRRADAVITVAGWEQSKGSVLGLPILHAWGDESYSGAIMRQLGRTPDGYRVEHRGTPGTAFFPFWGTDEGEHAQLSAAERPAARDEEARRLDAREVAERAAPRARRSR